MSGQHSELGVIWGTLFITILPSYLDSVLRFEGRTLSKNGS